MLLIRSNFFHIKRLPSNILNNYLCFSKANSVWFSEGKRCLHTVATVQNRTSRLLELLENAKNDKSRLVRLEELNEHLLRYHINFYVVKYWIWFFLHQLLFFSFPRYPSARSLARRSGVTRILQHCNESEDKEIQREARKGLVLLGWTVPVKGQGIKILSIDGGGSRWGLKYKRLSWNNP